MSKSIRQQFVETFKSVKAEEDAKRRKKREALKDEGYAGFMSRWVKRVFYTTFMLMAVYLIVMSITLILPYAMGMFLGMLGYNLTNMAEILLSFLSGLFFTAWVFVISFFLVRVLWRKYLSAMSKTKRPES